MQAPETFIDLREDGFTRQASPVGARSHPPVQLGRDDDVSARRVVDDGAAKELLARSVRVAVGGVEEVDSGIESPADDRPGALLVERPGAAARHGIAESHTPQTQRGDLQTGPAELAVPHVTSRPSLSMIECNQGLSVSASGGIP